MFRQIAVAFSIGLASVAVVGVARADDNSAQDKHFVDAAATGGMMEVKLGEYAAANAGDDGVKQFGEKMKQDHSMANDELKQIANDKGIDVPKDLPHDEHSEMDHLEKMNGAEFDKAYMAMMVEDHQKTISAFEKEVQDGNEPKLKEFAEKTLPTLKEHLKMAEELNKKVGNQ